MHFENTDSFFAKTLKFIKKLFLVVSDHFEFRLGDGFLAKTFVGNCAPDLNRRPGGDMHFFPQVGLPLGFLLFRAKVRLKD